MRAGNPPESSINVMDRVRNDRADASLQGHPPGRSAKIQHHSNLLIQRLTFVNHIEMIYMTSRTRMMVAAKLTFFRSIRKNAVIRKLLLVRKFNRGGLNDLLSFLADR